MPPAAHDTEVVGWFSALSEERRLAHGYLLVSRDAIALSSAAREILRAVDGAHRAQLADARVVEPDGTSIGIDAVRDLREHLAAFPGVAPYRTALVLRAELLTTEAQNALLKVAEEPAPRSVLFLAATDEERLLPTLRSRLQRTAVPRLSDAGVAAWLREEHGVDEEAAATFAARAGGSLARAGEIAMPSAARAVAESLMRATGSQHAAIAKAAAADEVPLQEVLRALSVLLSYTVHTPRTRELWHRVQRLTRAAQSSPLSLRIQVAALFSDLPHD